jgi:hypothetical protein
LTRLKDGTKIRETPAQIVQDNPDGSRTFIDKSMPHHIQKKFSVDQRQRIADARAAAHKAGVPYSDGIDLAGDKLGKGWKIHLSVQDDVNDPLVREITGWLDKRRIDYKVGQGGDFASGDGMTIYAGPRDQLDIVAKALHDHKFKAGPLPKATCSGEEPLFHDIAVRFDVQRDIVAPGLQYGKYGRYGLSQLDHYGNGRGRILGAIGDNSDDLIRDDYTKIHNMLVSKYGAFYTGTKAHVTGDLAFKANKI